MKTLLILFFGLMFLCDCALCYTNYYNNAKSYRHTYSPYRNNLGYTRYQNKLNNKKAIKKIQQRQKINRAKKLYNQISTLFNNNGYNQGALTGYSVPINQDAFSQISPKMFHRNKLNSPMCRHDLFSNDVGTEIYNNDGTYYKNLKEMDGKTGVTIIYD